MPGGNRTGPNGEGPKTGRGLGYCSGSDTPGYTKGAGMVAGMGAGRGFRSGPAPGFGGGFRTGRSFGAGRGFGCGRGRGFHSAPGSGTGSAWYAQVDEAGYLESRINSLKQELADLTKRLNGLRPQQPSEKE